MDLSPGMLFASIVVGAVGFGFFQYGRKQQRIPQLVTGIVLMGYPYFVASVWWMLAIGVAIVAAMWATLKAGF